MEKVLQLIKDFLAKLGASAKITVGVSVSPVVGLEMIEIDRISGTVNKYAHKPLEYNYSTREIASYDKFRKALEDLFDELKISKKSNIILSLPNVHFGIITLPMLLSDEAIANSILSEVEESYIFKRQDAVISWADVYADTETENRTIVYTAIQENALDEIKAVCAEVGCTLIGVESSYASMLKALSYTNIAEEQMKEGATWNLMLIGQNSYSILSMKDKKVMEYYEEPLALKSFVDNEIYNAITTSAQLTLGGLNAQYLYIISETDLVSAEVLSMKMTVSSSIKYLECNKYTQKELLPANLNILSKLALQITPESIGAAIYSFCNYPLKMNFVKSQEADMFGDESTGYPRITVGNIEIELTPDFVKRISIIIGLVVVLPLLIMSFVISGVLIPKEQSKLDAISQKITNTQAMIDKYTNSAKSNTFDIKTETQKILDGDKTNLAYYSGLGISIPNKLWVTYYSSNENGKVDIKGGASNVDSVYTFYKTMKQLINNSDIRLYKLEIASASIDALAASDTMIGRGYNFEITNMTEAELAPPAAPATTTAPPQGAPPPSNTPNAPATNMLQNLFNKGPNSQQNMAPQPSPQPSPQPAPPSGQRPGAPGTNPANGNLPNNLQKIEKF